MSAIIDKDGRLQVVSCPLLSGEIYNGLLAENIHCAELAAGAFFLALINWQELQRHPWKKSYRGK